MHAGQVATDAAVIEARRRERPLGVALAAARRQAVRVDVVLAMAVDAEVATTRERTVIAVATLARDVVVAALEREVADVVQWLHVLPRLRRVALLARGAVLTLVHRGLGVTAEAVRRARLERDRWMAVRAANLEVTTVDAEPRLRVVVEDVVAGLDVALLALGAEVALVRVVVGVAARVRALAVRRREVALRVTGLALVVLVRALERELVDRALVRLGERLVVIEAQRRPHAGRVALLALVRERSFMERVLVTLRVRAAARRDLVERRLILLLATRVALGARDVLVPLHEREPRLRTVIQRRRVLRVDLRVTGLDVAVATAEALAVVVLPIVRVLVLVAAHAVDGLALDEVLEVLEVRRTGAAVTRATRRLEVLRDEREARASAVVERRRLPLRRRVTRLTRGWITTERLEALPVLVVLRVALIARADGLRFAERLGVAVVALELVVRAEVEARALAVIEEALLRDRLDLE